MSKPITYVCLLSHYTIASAQAIKFIQPHRVLAVTTAKMTRDGITARFRAVVESWGVSLTTLGDEANSPFPAESMHDSKKWLKSHVEPRIREARNNGHRLVANLTGSTKAAAIALNELTDWDERHYTAEGCRDRIEVIGHPDGSLFALPSLEILEEVKLLNYHVKDADVPWPDLDLTRAISAAATLYNDCSRGKDASVMGTHGEVLRALWYMNESHERSFILQQAGFRVEGCVAWIPPGALQNLLKQMSDLDPSACQRSGDWLGIPASRKHRWCRFVAGTWWEYLVAHWATRHSLDIKTGVKILRQNDRGQPEQDSESDILLRRPHGDLGLIECKVEPPDSSRLTEMAWKMSDRVPFFGKSSAAFAVSPAFWWVANTEAAEAFRRACQQRGFALLHNEQDLRAWAVSSGTTSNEQLRLYYPAPDGRSADAILKDAQALILSWRDGTEARFRELRAEMAAAHPDRVALLDDLICKRKRVKELLQAAYKVGSGSPKYSWNDLCDQAEKLNIPSLVNQLEKQCKMGQKAAKRFHNEREQKLAGGPLSKVHPRPHQAQPTTAPPSSNTSPLIPPPPSGLHPNDIRALAPAPAWFLLLDETGADFGGERNQRGGKGRFVGLLVNANAPLPDLPRGWHAVECSQTGEIDSVIQAVLNAPCGVLGLQLDALPETPGERWLDGMRALVDWTLRILPLNGPTHVDVLIEARPPFKPGTEPDTICRDAMAMLARAWPERARMISLRAKFISKNEHPLNGYVDALAFVWGSSSMYASECLRRSGLINTCFLNFPARDLAACWDHWDQAGGLDAASWARLVASPDARNTSSIAAAILHALANECRASVRRWSIYLEEARRHLYSGAVDIVSIAAMNEWLEFAKPTDAAIPPSLRLVWLTAKLARTNHVGKLEQAWMAEMRSISSCLREEAAPLCCHADLHLAVNATNRFDFVTAAEVLKSWDNVPPAVTGLRYWGQLQSSIGQHRAFVGNLAGARAAFVEAIAAFNRLSDPAEKARDLSQTGCYNAIAAMDDPTVPDDTVRRLVVAITGDLPVACADLAKSVAAKDKYAHHLLLRWLIVRRDDVVAKAYLSEQAHWQADEGHPWPLIQLYRGMLLQPFAPAEALELAMDATALAFGSDQGPTVRLIGACCRAITSAWGEPWPQSNDVIAELREALPLANNRLDILEAFIAKPTNALDLLRDVLPFNFH